LGLCCGAIYSKPIRQGVLKSISRRIEQNYFQPTTSHLRTSSRSDPLASPLSCCKLYPLGKFCEFAATCVTAILTHCQRHFIGTETSSGPDVQEDVSGGRVCSAWEKSGSRQTNSKDPCDLKTSQPSRRGDPIRRRPRRVRARSNRNDIASCREWRCHGTHCTLSRGQQSDGARLQTDLDVRNRLASATHTVHSSGAGERVSRNSGVAIHTGHLSRFAQAWLGGKEQADIQYTGDAIAPIKGGIGRCELVGPSEARQELHRWHREWPTCP
jgi:hypothetical protein